jgi:hypothetical protein
MNKGDSLSYRLRVAAMLAMMALQYFYSNYQEIEQSRTANSSNR